MLELCPKRVFSLEESRKEEKIYELGVVLKDAPGALSKTVKILANSHINIKTGAIFYSPESKDEGFLTCFIDTTKIKKPLEKIKTELLKLDVISDVKFVEPKPAPFDILHFPVLHGSSRATIMPIEVFGALWSGFEQILKSSGLSAVLYNVGKGVGKQSTMNLIKTYNFEGEVLLDAILQSNQSTGWGRGEVMAIDLKEPSACLKVLECFEAMAWHQNKSHEACNWTRGYFAGSMSVVFNKPVEATETKCLAKGDPYCLFQITKR